MFKHCTASVSYITARFDATLQLVYITDLSHAVSGKVGDTETCTGSVLECNPNVIYATIAPLAAVTTSAIVGALIIVLMKATTKAKQKAI